MQLLLDLGADIEHQASGTTTLMFVARKGNAKMVELLLEHGANPLAVNDKGQIALLEAVSNGELEVARVLAPLSDKNYKIKGKSILAHACERGLVDVACLLLEHGFSHGPNELIISALGCRSHKERCELVKLVLPHSDPWLVGEGEMVVLESMASHALNSHPWMDSETNACMAGLIADATLSVAKPDYEKLSVFSRAVGMATVAGSPEVAKELRMREKALLDRLALAVESSLAAGGEVRKSTRPKSI